MTTTEVPTPSPCQTLSSRRVLPSTPPSTGHVTTPLSIADATCARFSICGAIWFYDASPATQDTAVLVARLEQSLSQNLDDYRHFAGQLRWSTPQDASILPGPQTLGRPLITYNAPTDPGVEFTHVAAAACTLRSLVPSSKERTGTGMGMGVGKKVWRATDFEQDALLPSCPLAFHPDLGAFDGLPGVSVQVTVFACGGWALGVRMTHCLGDAVCLTAFVRAWAARTRALVVSGPKDRSDGVDDDDDDDAGAAATKSQSCLFHPALLDQHAGTSYDERKIALARSLPMHRYDWWDADAPGIPTWARRDALAARPQDAQTLTGLVALPLTLSPATPPPWSSWDASAAVDHVQIRVTAAEVRRVKQAAHASLPPRNGEREAFVSRLDALVAHFWLAINRARGLAEERSGDDEVEKEEDEEEVYLNMSIGLRSRVSPPLPNTFAGSPLLNGYIARKGTAVRSVASLGSVALQLRRMVAEFTPEAVGAWLHDAAHETSPQRLWQAFLGMRHTGVTSWTNAGVYEVDFGAGMPRYVQARMPRCDGLLQIMDLAETGDYEISLCLEREAMKRLLSDDMLWAWGTDGS